MPFHATLDHITIAALTLEEGVAYVRSALNIDVPFGGAHPLMGTHNCLMRLGEGAFLEIIAPDPAVTPQRRRWFGLDDPAMQARLAASPQFITWVVRVPDLADTLRDGDATLGEAVRVTRGELSWLLSIPQDGSMPFDGAHPALIQWPAGPHPSSRMTDLGCGLERFWIEHPEAVRLTEALDELIDDDRIVVEQADAIRFRATIRTPGGLRELC